MRWPLRRKSRSNPTAPASEHAAGPRVPAPSEQAWRHAAALTPLIDRDPRVTRPVAFSRAVPGSRSMIAGASSSAPGEDQPVGLVHLRARPMPLVNLDLETGPGSAAASYEALLPPAARARFLPTVGSPGHHPDLLHAPVIDDDDGFDSGWGGFGSPGEPPLAPDPAPEVIAPDRMRVFRPRRLGLGDPLPEGTRPGDLRPEREQTPEPPPIDESQLDDAIRDAIREVEAARGASEAVPHDLRNDLSSAFGTDVGDHPIHRGPDVTRRAQGMAARAFTHQGRVFVSDDVGSLSQREARATVAHELTHLAQQRSLGTALPDENTTAGWRLEAAARSVEDYVRGTPDALRPTPDLLHPDRVQQADVLAPDQYAEQVGDELVARGLAHRNGIGDLVVGPSPSSTQSTSGVQRQPTATAPAEHLANPHSFGQLWDNLVTDTRATTEHAVLDEWHLSPELQRQMEIDDEVDARTRTQLREHNEQIDRANTNRPSGQPAASHADHLTDEQTRQIHAQVDDHFNELDRKAGGPQARTGTQQPGGGVGAGGLAPGQTPGTHPAGGTAATTPAGNPADSADVHSFREFGEHLGHDVGASMLGLWGLDLAAMERHDAAQRHAATPAAANAQHPAPTPGAHPGAATTAAATQHAAAGASTAAAALHAAGTGDHSFAHLEDHEVEDLVRRVYARLRTSLRSELLVDRERAGMLADFR